MPRIYAFDMVRVQLSRAGFLLAGGKSSRMGTDKALLQFRGQTLLDRALTVMTPVCNRVMLVGDPDRFAKYGVAKNLPIVTDIFPDCGPLGGIHAALVHSTAELNLMMAVDMPFVSEKVLEFLFSAAEASNAVITVPRAGRGLQPLCAVYRRDFSAAAEQSLRAGMYKIEAVFTAVPIQVIEERNLVAAGFSERTFFNVNTPQDRLAVEGA
jgi:molybdenum cofactor guanylyltransferase